PEEVCTLIITEVYPEDSGEFRCIVENEAGTAVSAARLSVSPVSNKRNSEYNFYSSIYTLHFKICPGHLPYLASGAYLKLSPFPASSQQLTSSNPGQRVAATYNQSPASFLSSVLPSQPDYSSRKIPSTVDSKNSTGNNSGHLAGVNNSTCKETSPIFLKISYQQPVNAKPTPRTPDHEIQGSKEALIQDLERKLKCKDSLLHNGNQRLTYEEKMARRLLGPQNAAAVFQAQNDNEAQDSLQIYKGQDRVHINEISNSFCHVPVSKKGINFKQGIKIPFIPSQQAYKKLGTRGKKQVWEAQNSSCFCSMAGFPKYKIFWCSDINPKRCLLKPDIPLLSRKTRTTASSDITSKPWKPNSNYTIFAHRNPGALICTRCFYITIISNNHQISHRSRSSSRGDVNDQDAIQEKFYPPRFIQVPENMSIEEGRFCRMDFKVSGLPAPDVSWYLNGRPVQSDDFHKMIVSEKGFHSLLFEVVRTSDTGDYVCVAKNRAGEATFTVQLDVIAKEHRRAPMFIYKPQSKKVFEGDTVKLECQISAVPPPKLFWKRNNEMVQFNTDRISLYHDNSGRVTLLIKDVNKKDAGWYTVSAVNEAGVTTCNTRLDVT
uniref:Myotilin n=1 Tax=Loxodonta africana TaxID=9785 RepID=G3U5J5_LOXAF